MMMINWSGIVHCSYDINTTRAAFLFTGHMIPNLLFDLSRHADLLFLLYCALRLAGYEEWNPVWRGHIHFRYNEHTHTHTYTHKHTHVSYFMPGLTWLPPPSRDGFHSIALELLSSIFVLNTHLPTHPFTQSGTTSSWESLTFSSLVPSLLQVLPCTF